MIPSVATGASHLERAGLGGVTKRDVLVDGVLHRKGDGADER